MPDISKELFLKYGRHLRSCELSRQPNLGNTSNHWSCDCGFSVAVDCQLCKRQGYVVGLQLMSGRYLTGHCPDCGMI